MQEKSLANYALLPLAVAANTARQLGSTVLDSFIQSLDRFGREGEISKSLPKQRRLPSPVEVGSYAVIPVIDSVDSEDVRLYIDRLSRPGRSNGLRLADRKHEFAIHLMELGFSRDEAESLTLRRFVRARVTYEMKPLAKPIEPA